MTLERALELARAGREQAERDFFEELRIPSVSTLADHRTDVRHNCDWLAERFRALEFDVQITDQLPRGDGGDAPARIGHPVLQADWRGAGEEAPTLTIYGHYDVQPPDPLDEWETPPFEPTVRDGHVFARGASDNKGNHMAALKAAEYAVATGAPVNLRFLIEGEEEISGESLPAYLRERAQALKSEYTLIWDGGFTPDDRPALVTGLRGILYTQIDAQGPRQDIHSGGFGGVAPNPNNTVARIVAALKDRDGRITIPGFYDAVVPPGDEEAAAWDRSSAFGDRLRELMGAPALEGEPEYTPVERLWARPTLDCNGILGGFTDEGEKTVIPARAMAKVSMRLVPDQDPKQIFAALESYVQTLTTPGVTVTVRRLGDAPPVQFDPRSHASQALRTAYEAAFGTPAVPVRMGGTVPVSTAFQSAVAGQILCSGLAQAGAGAHGPNESFRLDNYHRGTEMLLRLLYSL